MLRYTSLALLIAACNGKTAEESPAPEESPTGDDSTPIVESDPNTDLYGPANAWYHASVDQVPSPESTGWRRGQTPPDLHLVDQNGDEVWLYQFTGRTVYVDLFGEWCGPCNTDAPYLQRFWQEHQDDVVLLGIAETDRNYLPGDADTVARWVTEHGLTNPVTYAPNYDDLPHISSYPTIFLLDTELRVGQPNVRDLGDSWISQFIERMAFMIGGNLDDTEVCGDGIDNDLNGSADCMESACATDCAEQTFTGSISPCTPGETVTGDYYRVTVPDEVITLEADTVSAETTFDVLLRAVPEGGDWADAITVGDDEVPCTFPPRSTACPQGWLRPGVWTLGVMPANGTGNTGQCTNPDLAEYLLKIQGNATVELVSDDLTGPAHEGN